MQLPQWSRSEVSSTQALLQLVRPAAHDAVHADFEHTSPPKQITAQPPQLSGSEVVSTHFPSQSVLMPHDLPPSDPDASGR